MKILHYDINGWVLCSKWFTDGKFLKPEFEECKITHELSRETLILIMSTSVQPKMRADNAEQMLGEARKALEESNKRISVLSKKVKTIDDLKEVADAADKAALDAKQVVELINRRVFQRNSDATRFLNGEIDPNW